MSKAQRPLKPNQFVYLTGPRGGRTIATVSRIWKLPNNPSFYGAMTLVPRSNGVRHSNSMVPKEFAQRNRQLWMKPLRAK